MRSVGRGSKLVRATLCAWFACLGGLVGAPNAAAVSHPFLYSIEKWVPAPNVVERFENPCGVATDSNGDVYASDYYHHVVDVFWPGQSTFLTRTGASEPPSGPCGLAVDSAGRLFVNFFHNNVTRFVPQAFPLAQGTKYDSGTVLDSNHPTGVAVDLATNRVYVDARTYVAVYDSSGAPVLDGGTPLKIGLGSLGDAYGVAVSGFAGTSGYVYVADAADDLIKVYDPAVDLEAPVATIDGSGTPQGAFTSLRDASLALDQSTGHLYVAYNAQGALYEHPLAAVAEFNPAGEYRGTLPAPTPLWFGEPSGITVDNFGGARQGRVYVTTGNSSVDQGKAEEGAVYAFGPGAPGQRLEVTVGGLGAGSVASSPAGIACPPACAAEYDNGASVTLTATAAPGSVFTGWSGEGCSGTGSCTVAMSQSRTVAAQFDVASSSAAGTSAEGGAGSATAAPTDAVSASVSGIASSSPGNAATARTRHPARRRKHRHHHHRPTTADRRHP